MGELDTECCSRYNIRDLFLDYYDYGDWFMPLLEDYEKVPTMSLLECNEEEAKSKRNQILTPNKLLTRLAILFAQMKTGNNSYKLKDAMKQLKTIYNNLIKPL